MPISDLLRRWQERPENQRRVRVRHHYWIDPGTDDQLAHLVPGDPPEGVHDAWAVCETVWARALPEPLVGVSSATVPVYRACPKCVDAQVPDDVTYEEAAT